MRASHLSLALLGGFTFGCGLPAEPPSAPEKVAPAPPAPRPAQFEEDDELTGLRVHLRSVRDTPTGDADGSPPPPAEPPRPLDEAAVDALLGRVPPLVVVPDDQLDFRVRKGSPPPPMSGDDVQASFPARPSDAPQISAGPVHVVRSSPEGEVPLAPRVSVTFDQPMVALTTQDEAAKTVPITLEPQPEGSWRWLGTRTLVFDPAERMPQATEYTVTIPAGITSVAGTELSEATSFTFGTPPPTLQDSWPHGDGHPLQPVIGLYFDQAVDADAVVQHVSLSGGRALRLADDAEREEVPQLTWRRDVAEDQLVLLTPAEPLPPSTQVTLNIPAGLVGLEGPRPTTARSSLSFRTYDPLRIDDHRCGWDDTCPPNQVWTVDFNNALEEEQDLSGVTVSPELPGLHVDARGGMLTVSGAFEARTRYTLTVPATMKDRFGQTLGRDKRLVFQVGPARPTFDAAGHSFVVLDPNGGGTWPVFTTNHAQLKATVHRVDPGDWPAWRTYRDRYRYDDDTPGRLPGEAVRNQTQRIENAPDELVETAIDLSEYLNDGGYGHFVALVQPQPQPRSRWDRTYEMAWVQVTRLGLHAFVDGDEVLVWVSDLATGDPLEGVSVALDAPGRADLLEVATGADGLARLPLVEGVEWLVATRGDDVAILPATPDYGSGGWHPVSSEAGMRWFVADDRGLYKPGETAHVKGWLRRVTPGPEGDLVLPTDPEQVEVQWRLIGSRGNELGKGTEALSEQGGFDLTLEIPGDANLGDAWLHLSTVDGSHRHRVPIQEFRRPEVEVSATADRDRFVLGEEATVEARAAYFTGGALPDAAVTWRVHATDAGWRPPGHTGFSFGTWAPRWWSWRGPMAVDGEEMGPWTHLGRTDATGRHRLGLHVEAMGPPRARTLRVEGTVEDVNRQAWTGADTLVVHPAAVAVGVRSETSFVEPDEPMALRFVVVDLDGAVQSERPVEAVLERLSGWWDPSAEEVDRCQAVTDDEGLAGCDFTVDVGGSYRVRAETRDDLGRPTTSETRVWVSGAERAPSRNVTLEQVQLIPETDEVAPGDTARVLVSAPFAPSEAVITWRRSGLLHTERRRLETASTTVELPITNAHAPDLTLQVDLVGQAARTDDDGNVLPDKPKRVAHATGTLTMKVSTAQRALAVEVVPAADALAPGRDTELSVVVTDARGEPVPGAEVAVVVVDEAVLALSDYRLPDPMDLFYTARGAGVTDVRLRQWVALADPDRAEAATALVPLGRTGTGSGGGGYGGVPRSEPVAPDEARTRGFDMKFEVAAGEASEWSDDKDMGGALLLDGNVGGLLGKRNNQAAAPLVAVREDFSATALFAPAVVTDASGRASVPFTLPDSLTRYRVTAVAVHGGTQFGQGESAITARLPLMVRPSLPRFLNSGDQAELPVVLENQTDEPLDARVAMGVTNLALIDAVGPTLQPSGADAGGWRVTVPPRDRVEVRFPAATAEAGTAQVQIVATAGAHQDAARLELPVYTPATSEAFATTGSLTDRGLQLPVDIPDDVWKAYGGLEVTASSTQLQALTDAIIYLTTYPYECNEQVASRLLSVAALRDVLTAFEAEGLPAPADLEALVEADLDRLVRRQHPNGGFAFWRRGETPWPFLSIHVASAFAEARAAGYTVDDRAWSQSLTHLRNIDRHIPFWYHPDTRRFLRAFAVDVRRRMGDSDLAEARRLLGAVKVESQPLEVLGFLLPTLHEGGRSSDVDRILRHLGNRATETTAGAHFVTNYDNGAHVLLHSSRRADGILLRALLEVAPDDELLDKVTRDLLAHRTAGRWGSTQENAFVLLALRAYFDEREKETPDFVAKVWLGDGLVGEHPFQGRSTERYHVDVPLSALDDTQTLTMLRDGGAGRMFYRLALRYAPESLDLAPADRGFVVERRYEAVDDPADVTQDAEGTWHIRAGATVRVTVSMMAESRRYHVALVDPLPAGLEATHPELATSGTLPENPLDVSGGGRGGLFWWWSRTWYEHENLRDERAEAFTSLLWPGVHEYSYIARATTPGRYVVPPAKAEEMYSPETFGRSGTAKVIVD